MSADSGDGRAVEPAGGKPAAQVRRRAKAFTKVLGEFQDSVVARPVLRGRTASTEHDLAAAWNALNRGKSRSWLKG